VPDIEIQAAIDAYLRARHELLTLGRLHPERIGGNDNIIGRIGEFIALRFLERGGRRPVRVLGGANPGFDLTEGDAQIQVKVITEENQKGRNVRLTDPWTEFMLIELGAQYRPSRIGLISREQHRRACVENNGWSLSPYVKRTMLSQRGLIGRYGRVYTADEIAV
jgi:hypothetical protein